MLHYGSDRNLDLRTTEERKRPGAAFWTAIVVAAALSYPILLGPFCWASSRTGWGAGAVSRVYQPLIRLLGTGEDGEPGRVLKGLFWYCEVGAKDGWCWLPDGVSATAVLIGEGEHDEFPNQGPTNWLWMNIEPEGSGLFFW